MRLIHVSRGHLILDSNNKRVTIYGEAFLRGHGSPDFVLYSNGLDRWDGPHDKEKISQKNKDEIFEFWKLEFSNRNMTLEIE